MKEGCFKILLVDDEEMFLTLLEDYLRDEISCEVEKVTSGHAAIQLLNQDKKFDFIISDFIMPHGSGGELLAYFSKTDMKAHFILHTSVAGPTLPSHDHRFLGVIDKFEYEKIITKIKETINARS